MMNTNNAPEIVLEPMWNIDVGPCFAVKGKDWLPADKMRDISAFLNHALQAEFAAALQPQVSESDEAVLLEALRKISNTGQTLEPDHWKFRCMARETASDALARHRQPAAVSADAAQVTRDIVNHYRAMQASNFSHHQMMPQLAYVIQAYGDQRELNGARKYRDAMREKLMQRIGNEEYGHAKAAVSLDIEELDALSPETVVGVGDA